MQLNGDLNKFHQPDLVTFIVNLDKEGVLTVTHDDVNLSVGIKGNVITDVYSERGDKKILSSLLYRGMIDKQRMAKISRMKQETAMPVIHILDKLNLIENIKNIPEAKLAVQEVLLQFFLLDAGNFQFLDVPVEGHGPDIPLRPTVLDLMSHVDEWKDIERKLSPLSRRIVSRVPEKILLKVPQPARHIISAATNRPIDEVIESSPIYSYQALKIINQALSKKLLTLGAPDKAPVSEKKEGSRDALRQSFKKAYGHILQPRGDISRIDRLVSFCKYYFDNTAVVSVREGRIFKCIRHAKDPEGLIESSENDNIDTPVEDDPVFAGVNRSGVAFFGKIEFSDPMKRLLHLPASGECALLLVERLQEESVFLFALSNRESGNAFQYLRFFSEMMASNGDTTGDDGAVSVGKQAEKLVSEIDDIPPMPHIVSRILQLLADPEISMTDLGEALSEDSAMVARIIRVGNSALYRGVQEVISLNQALARLGIKAIRSILLSSATRALFPAEKNGGGMLGQTLWQHTKECALASRRIADYVNYPDPEEAFVGGMLHDIGKIVILLKHRNDYQHIRKLQIGVNLSSLEAEQSVVGFDHCEIGGMLMEKWNMPGILKTCAQGHHRPALTMIDETLPRIVAYGNSLSNLHGVHEYVGADLYIEDIKVLRDYFKIDDSDARELENLIIEDFEHTDVFD